MGEITERLAVPGPSPLPKDLVPRLLSALVMAAVALACNWAGSVPFALLVFGISLAMSWEWARIVRGVSIDSALIAHAISVTAAVILAAYGATFLAMAAVVAGVIAVFACVPGHQGIASGLGVAYVGVPAIALVWLRGGDGYGALAILFIFVIVWTTDTFAYLTGRLIGGPKLWLALSPGKTWAGTIGGLAFAALAGLLFATSAAYPTAPLALAGVAILLSVVSQIGDLGESALKRSYDVKNASDLIPGHGGFMDRMDGIVTAATSAAILAALRAGSPPGQALLFWP